MKLKKLMALALSGVLAVSMFAGCAKGNVKPEPTPNPEEPTATGYSAMLDEKVDDKNDDKNDYVTFADNADDEAALEYALNSVGQMMADELAYVKDVTEVGGRTKVAAEFTDKAELTSYRNLWTLNNNWTDGETVKDGILYVVDGTIAMENVLDDIAVDVLKTVKNLPNTSFGTRAKYSFDYVVSVSVVNKPVTIVEGYTDSANFIAVTITRTATQL